MSGEELAREILENHMLDIKMAKIDQEIVCDFEKLARYNVIVDSKRIGQVFSNIMYNAIKFTEEGGKIAVRIEVDEKNKVIEWSISDTGKGILKQELPFIFDRFYKSQIQPKAQSPKGSGLGLTISKEIIMGHGGEIRVKSDPGKGSVFTFEIPIYYDE
jgi:signal transduction histidine kinase